jgi:Rieske Fe-S protein
MAPAPRGPAPAAQRAASGRTGGRARTLCQTSTAKDVPVSADLDPADRHTNDTVDPTRRTVLRGSAVAGLGAVVAGLAGCAGGTTTTGTSPGGPTPSRSAPQVAAGTKLVASAEVPVGGGIVLRDRKIVVTQPTAGTYKGFSAVCTHMGCTVASVADGTINCPCHGSKFAIADGSPAHGPAFKPLPPVDVVLRGGTVMTA